MARASPAPSVASRPLAAVQDPDAPLRDTGIDVVGKAPWGTHFCQFYASKDDLRDVLVSYFRAGLEADEFCMWITSPPLEVEEAWRALSEAVPDLEGYRRRGRIEILPHTEWYLRDGVFDQERVLQGWVAKLDAALARGCTGLRLSGNTFWLEKSGWRSFAEYEAAVDGVLGRYRMLALCTYAVDRCGVSEVADVVRNHQFAIIKRDGRWELFESFERRRMEDALVAERERLAVTLQSIGDGVIGTDTDGRVTTLNHVAEALTGWTRAEATGRPVDEVFRIVREEDGAPLETPVPRVLAEGTVSGIGNHTLLVARDGRRFPIHDSAAPIRGPRGERLGAVLVFRDASAARQAERERERTIRALRDEEARSRQLLEESRRGQARIERQNAVLSGIARILREALTCDTEEDLGRVCMAVAEEVTGSAFAFIGEVNPARGTLDDLAISDPGWAACQMQPSAPGRSGRLARSFAIRGLYGRVLRDGKGFFTNDPASHPDRVGTPPGHPPLRAFLGVPLLHGGETIGVIALANRPGGYAQEQLEAAEALATATVEALLRKRAEEEVRRANARLTDADRRKDEFLGMLSHELRNPLAPIRNAIYVLDHGEATAEQARRARGVLRRQAEHLARIVDDLLDITRIARGKMELKRARVDLAAVVRRAGEDHAALVRDRGVALAIQVPPGPAWADGDPTRVAQVIGNLLHNASKFTPRGGRVTLALEVADGAAEIRVRDSGAGIEPELLAHVFDPFVQGKRTLARTEGGLGLGLALVKGVAELHGGSVRASSAGPGQGAELVVRLPLAQAGAAPAAPPSPAPRATARRRVLVVDDNEDAAESLAQLVELFGHDADVAHDGASALALARQHPPDVVFCDIGLPGMTGYDVVRVLKSEEAFRRTRVFAVSGYAQPEDRRRASEAGFDGHVPKPSDPAEIERILA